MKNILTKNCVTCQKDFTKSSTCGLPEWGRRKACSRGCENIRRKGLCFSPLTTFEKGIIPWSKENMKGVSVSPETQFKKGGKALNPFKKGMIPWNKGERFTKCSGENHWNWKGGVSVLNHLIRNLPEMTEWRNSIFKRDNYTCQKCEQYGGKLNADHIKPFSFILKEDEISTIQKALDCKELWDTSNGRTLCIECHRKRKTINQYT